MRTAEQLLAEARISRQEGKIEEARAALVDAVQLLRTGGRQLELAHALRTLGELDRSTRRPDGALAAYEEAVQILRAEGAHRKLAHTLRHLGEIKRASGRAAEALACCDEAFEIYRVHGAESTLEEANTLRSVALACEAVDELERAARCWADAERLYDAADVAAGVEESRVHLNRLRAMNP